MPNKRRKKETKNSKKSKNEGKPMPSLIFNSVTLPNEETEIPKKSPADYPDNSQGKKLMWGGVIAVSMIIFIFWTWSMAQRFSTVKFGKSPEAQLAASAKNNWAQAFEETKMEESKKNALEDLKNVLSQFISSNTPSSSPAAFTNSTNGVTSTSTTTTPETPTTTVMNKK